MRMSTLMSLRMFVLSTVLMSVRIHIRMTLRISINIFLRMQLLLSMHIYECKNKTQNYQTFEMHIQTFKRNFYCHKDKRKNLKIMGCDKY